MTAEFSSLLTDIRNQFENNAITSFDFNTITEETSISKGKLHQYVEDERHLVLKMLEQERGFVMSMLKDLDDESVNAIDALILVSKKISTDVNRYVPFIARHVINRYPEIYKVNFQKRIDFISKKISANVDQGIKEGLYRSDISVELLSRLFISLFMDFYMEDPKKYNGHYFQIFFNKVFERFILRASTEKGLHYYEAKKTGMEIS